MSRGAIRGLTNPLTFMIGWSFACATAAAIVLYRRRRLGASSSPIVAHGPNPGNEKQSGQPLVVVVGLGGVGSHAAQLLVRGGVRRLRLVDFDQVTLSSLNRHATAVRSDVGTPKVQALRAHLLRVAPHAEVEAVVALFDAEAASRLLTGSPALVVDCIDDLSTKSALLEYCVHAGLPVLSSLGAGGKGDCCALHVGRLSEVFNDPIAASLLKRLRKPAGSDGRAGGGADGGSSSVMGGGVAGGGADACVLSACAASNKGAVSSAYAGDSAPRWWDELPHRVPVVYSSEPPQVGLLPLPEGASAAELGSQASFRVRVMPVLPPLPASVGATLAARALSVLRAERVQPPPRPVPSLQPGYQTRLYRQFLKRELKELGTPAADVRLTYHEVNLVVSDIFRSRSALSGLRLHDPSRPTFCLVRFDGAKPADASNVLFVTVEEARTHEREGIGALPPHLRQHVEHTIQEALAGRPCSLFEAARRREARRAR